MAALNKQISHELRQLEEAADKRAFDPDGGPAASLLQVGRFENHFRSRSSSFLEDTPEDTPEAEIFRMRRFLRTYEHTRELEDSLIALGYMAEAERFRFGVDPARVREALRELEDAVASRPPGCA